LTRGGARDTTEVDSSISPASPAVEITVAITVYDEGLLLLETVESAVTQQGSTEGAVPAWEVIVVHDRGASAATLDALDVVRRTHPHVRIVQNRGRRGPAGGRNTAIAAARGGWVAFLDGDDVWFPTALAERWHAVRQQPDAGWIAADFLRGPSLEQAGDPAGFIRSHPHLSRLVADAAEVRAAAVTEAPLRLKRPVAAFCEANLAFTGTVMVRRDLIRAVGGFNERLRRDEDAHLWIRLSAVSDLLFVPRVLAFYRTRPSTLARRGASLRGWEVASTLDLLRRPGLWKWFGHLYRTRMVRMMNEQAHHLRGHGRYASAATWSLASGVACPAQSRAWRNLGACLLRRR
jgi:glycosyltransferase involved in cell wall biosynthesis